MTKPGSSARRGRGRGAGEPAGPRSPAGATRRMRPSAPTSTTTPGRKRPPLQVRAAARACARSLTARPRRSRSGRRRARGPPAPPPGRPSARARSGRWATSIDAGAEDRAVEPQALEPAGVGGVVGALQPLPPGQREQRGGDRRLLVQPHRRAVGEHLELVRHVAGGGRGGGAQPLDHRRRLHAGEQADSGLDDAAVGDDVDRRAAVHGADVEGDEGDVGEAVGVRRRLGGEPSAQPAEGGDHRRAGLDGVDAEMRVAAVGAGAVEGDAHLQVPLVQADDGERGGLADDRSPRQRRAGRRAEPLSPLAAEAFHQVLGAQRPHLLVVGEGEHQRRRQSLGVGGAGEVGGEGEEPFHVGGAAADQAVAGVGQSERVAAPPLFFGGDDVHVAGEDEPGAGFRGRADRRLRPQGDDQVDLAAVVGAVLGRAHAGAVEVVGEEAGHLQVAVAAGGVEGHQPSEELGV